jgi:hypothetical protein
MKGWRKLHSKAIYKWYSSRYTIRIMKSRRMRWAGQVAFMGEKCQASFSWENLKERDL